MRWVDGWPRFLDPAEPVPPVVARPRLPRSPGTDWSRWREEFDAPLSADWIRLRTPDALQRVMLGDGALKLVPSAESAGSLGKPSFVGRRLRHHSAEYVTRMDFAPQDNGEFAGLLAFMDESHFVALGVERGRIVLRRRTSGEETERGVVIAETAHRRDRPVELRIAFDGGRADFDWRPAGEPTWRSLSRDVDVEPLASIHAGLFTGLVVGPYAVAP